MLAHTDSREIVLRDYQSAAINSLREKIRDGQKRLVLCAGTGAGKTLMSGQLLKAAHRKGSYALFIVDRVALVDQTSAVFDQYGIPHGIVQGQHARWAPEEHVQVCSAQTLANRTLPRQPTLIVVDECHTRYKATMDFLAKCPDAVKIGLTATPFTKGMAQEWDGVVNVIPTRDLIKDGFLVEPRIYVAKSPDDSELGLNSFGEFSDESAGEAGIRIVGDVVAEWIKKTTEHFGGPAKTIVFSPTVEHGRELCDAFRKAGYNFEQISYHDKNDDERRAKIREFRKLDSTIHGLVSCGVLTKGFDVPEVRIGVSCRPYRKSLSSHMQEIGRVMRPLPDGTPKTALWLDHSGNFERFHLDMYDVWDNGVGELDRSTKRDSEKRERTKEIKEKAVCKQCSGAMRANICTCCGWERPARSSVTVMDGELREWKTKHLAMPPRDGLRAPCLDQPRKIWDACLYYAFEHGRRGPVASRKWAFGIFRGIYPTGKMPFGWYDARPPAMPDSAAYSLVEREQKRFRKLRRAA
jgi:superfamily II DNA or RNA helicase